MRDRKREIYRKRERDRERERDRDREREREREREGMLLNIAYSAVELS